MSSTSRTSSRRQAAASLGGSTGGSSSRQASPKGDAKSAAPLAASAISAPDVTVGAAHSAPLAHRASVAAHPPSYSITSLPDATVAAAAASASAAASLPTTATTSASVSGSVTGSISGSSATQATLYALSDSSATGCPNHTAASGVHAGSTSSSDTTGGKADKPNTNGPAGDHVSVGREALSESRILTPPHSRNPHYFQSVSVSAGGGQAPTAASGGLSAAASSDSCVGGTGEVASGGVEPSSNTGNLNNYIHIRDHTNERAPVAAAASVASSVPVVSVASVASALSDFHPYPTQLDQLSLQFAQRLAALLRTSAPLAPSSTLLALEHALNNPVASSPPSAESVRTLLHQLPGMGGIGDARSSLLESLFDQQHRDPHNRASLAAYTGDALDPTTYGSSLVGSVVMVSLHDTRLDAQLSTYQTAVGVVTSVADNGLSLNLRIRYRDPAHKKTISGLRSGDKGENAASFVKDDDNDHGIITFRAVSTDELQLYSAVWRGADNQLLLSPAARARLLTSQPARDSLAGVGVLPLRQNGNTASTGHNACLVLSLAQASVLAFFGADDAQTTVTPDICADLAVTLMQAGELYLQTPRCARDFLRVAWEPTNDVTSDALLASATQQRLIIDEAILFVFSGRSLNASLSAAISSPAGTFVVQRVTELLIDEQQPLDASSSSLAPPLRLKAAFDELLALMKKGEAKGHAAFRVYASLLSYFGIGDGVLASIGDTGIECSSAIVERVSLRRPLVAIHQRGHWETFGDMGKSSLTLLDEHNLRLRAVLTKARNNLVYAAQREHKGRIFTLPNAPASLKSAMKPAASAAATATDTSAAAPTTADAVRADPPAHKICTNCHTNRVSLKSQETECNTCLSKFIPVGEHDFAEQFKARQKARADQERSSSTKSRSNSVTSTRSDSSSRTTAGRSFDWRVRDAEMFIESGYDPTYVNGCYQQGKFMRDQNYLALAVASKGGVCPAGNQCPNANKRNSSCRTALHALSYSIAFEMISADSEPFVADDKPLSMESLLAAGKDLNINVVMQRLRHAGNGTRGGGRARGSRGQGGRGRGRSRGTDRRENTDDDGGAADSATASSASAKSSLPVQSSARTTFAPTTSSSAPPTSPQRATYADMLASKQRSSPPSPSQSPPASSSYTAPAAAPSLAAAPSPAVGVAAPPSTATSAPIAPSAAASVNQPAAAPDTPQHDFGALLLAMSAKLDTIIQENVELKAEMQINRVRIQFFEQLLSTSSRSTSPRTEPSQVPSPQHSPVPPVPPPEPPHSRTAGGGGRSA